MKFILQQASNGDAGQLALNHPQFANVIDGQLQLILKHCCSALFCLCCFLDTPSKSKLISLREWLITPPQFLDTNVRPDMPVWYFISYVQGDEKISLLGSSDQNVILAVLDELSLIYLQPKEHILLTGESILQLDANAKVWHALFNLPDCSKVTQMAKGAIEIPEVKGLSVLNSLSIKL